MHRTADRPVDTTLRKRGRGLVLGKFLPPHLGHVYLCEFARAHCEDLSIVVGTLAREPIQGALRHAWMSELFPASPTLRVLHHTAENPQQPSEHPEFWRLWRESLRAILVDGRPGATPALDYVFASEPYGERLAAELGAEWIPVDVARQVVPVSGTAIRRDPYRHWRYLPRCVRPHFVRRVAVVGAESSGKTTLARALVAHYQTVLVPEYARLLLERRATGPDGRAPIGPADIERIARGQCAAEEALARAAERVLVADTDLLTTQLWSELLFGATPAWLVDAAASERRDLWLVTDAADAAFEEDAVRYRPDARMEFQARLVEALERAGRPHLLVRGSVEERLAQATRAIDALLAPVAESASP